MASFGVLPEGRPLFLAVYAAVVAGILFSALVLLSAVYSSSATDKAPFYSRSSGMEKTNSSTETIQNVEKNVSHGKTKLKSDDMYTRAIWDPPVHKRMPDLKSFRLTKQTVEQRAENNVIIVTFGNYAFMDFILNWVKHLTDINVFNLLVGAMDTKLLEALYWKGIPVFDMGSHMATIDVGWGTPTFHKMGREKVLLINALLPFGFELLMCDTDMVWLKNPLPYFARFPEADILTSSDQTIPTVTDDSLEVWQQVSGSYNIGIFHWRPTDPAKKLAKEWKDMLLADDKIWDQTGFNDLVHKVLGPSVEGKNGLVYAYDGTLKLGILPASIFCSGHTYFVQAMYQQLGLEPYAVHATFQYAGTEGKRHRLREAMLFHDPPEYYDSPGGFLSFRPSIPKSFLLDGPHTVQSHFSLVNYQLKQIRAALAIASLLDRTLVMPPLWCRFDRMWYGHPGILEGTMTRQPFLCPMDHIFEVHVMLSSLSEAEFGPQIDFREYSFLQNPSTPSSVRESVLDVEICDEHSDECNPTNQAMRHGVIQFPKNSTEQKYAQVFSQYKDFKVIHFSSMKDVFQGFAAPAKEARFRNRVKRYAALWCCVENHEPGHIYYDMYWDEKPGWKPEPPANRSVDHPPW